MGNLALQIQRRRQWERLEPWKQKEVVEGLTAEQRMHAEMVVRCVRMENHENTEEVTLAVRNPTGALSFYYFGY